MKQTILVVEDEPSLRRALTDKFTQDGYRVLAADDGAAGARIGLAEQPDLIVLDIILPSVDGIAMLKMIRANAEWGANVPVMILTNSKERGDIGEALSWGVTQYLAKADWKIEDVVQKGRAMLASNVPGAAAKE